MSGCACQHSLVSAKAPQAPNAKKRGGLGLPGLGHPGTCVLGGPVLKNCILGEKLYETSGSRTPAHRNSLVLMSHNILYIKPTSGWDSIWISSPSQFQKEPTKYKPEEQVSLDPEQGPSNTGKAV